MPLLSGYGTAAKRSRHAFFLARFLNQNGAFDEETQLRATIETKYLSHLPEFEIALNTGMRPSEQYSLAWDRVDLFGRRITVPRSKSGKARHIPINSEALAAFRVLAQRSPNWAGPVFVNLKGEKLEGYKHWFNQAVEGAGLVDFTWYCLRHTFASRLVMAGVDIRTVAELMGHKTIQMTMRYAHLAPSTTSPRLKGSLHLIPVSHRSGRPR